MRLAIEESGQLGKMQIGEWHGHERQGRATLSSHVLATAKPVAIWTMEAEFCG